jgi:hypothetical protein
MCAMVGVLGAGTFAFIFCLAILIVLMLFYKIKIMKIICWIYFLLFVIVFAVLATTPVKTDAPVETTNPHAKYLITFGVFVFLGFLLSLVFYTVVVLLHQDFAEKIFVQTE